MLINQNITKNNNNDNNFYIYIYPGSQIILTLSMEQLNIKNIKIFNPSYNKGCKFSLKGDLHSTSDSNKDNEISTTNWYVGETITLSVTPPDSNTQNDYEWDGIYSAKSTGVLNDRLTSNKTWNITLYPNTNDTTYYSLKLNHYIKYFINAVAGDSHVTKVSAINSNGTSVMGSYVRENEKIYFNAEFDTLYEFDYWKDLGTGNTSSILNKEIIVSKNLTLYCYSKLNANAFLATAIVGTNGMTVTVSSGSNSITVTYADNNKSIPVIRGDSVEWRITNTNGNILFTYVLSMVIIKTILLMIVIK